ncbi:MAG: hypothetical protein K8R46_01245 [Pirellulales bacterium]|nr:hypothetical protein [Pirellulales bacterium]
MHYFGVWDDPEGALSDYLNQKDYLHTGRTPEAKGGLELLPVDRHAVLAVA